MRKNDLFSKIGGGVWIIIVLGAILSVINLNSFDNPDNLMNTLRDKAIYLSECVPNFNCDFSKDIDTTPNGPNVDFGELADYRLDPKDIDYKGPDGGDAYIVDSAMITKEGALKALNSLRIEEHEDIEYNRRDYKHWNTYPGRSCWTVRKEILRRESISDDLVLLDSKKNVVNDTDTACIIENGKWIDPYSNSIINESSKVDIDHVIPLSYAAKHGGDAWPAERKQEYANDVRFLLATSAKENRSKGDKGPSDYMPPYKDYHCAYAKTWVAASLEYDISMTQKDYNTLKRTLTGCTH